MAVALETDSIFGISVGQRISHDSVLTPERIDSLHRSLGSTKGDPVIPLAEISALFALQGYRPDVLEVIKQETGADGATPVYLRQTAIFYGNVQPGDRLQTELLITATGGEPGLRKLTAVTNVYKDGCLRVMTGEGEIGFALLNNAVDGQIERVGVFPETTMAERAREIVGMGTVSNFSTIRSHLLYVTEQGNMDFAKASGDHNGLHLNPDAAKRTLFKGRIAHGMRGMGLVRISFEEELKPFLEIFIKGKEVRCVGMDMTFRKPVYLGDIIWSEIDTKNDNPHGRDNGWWDRSELPFRVMKFTDTEDLSKRASVIEGFVTIAH